MVPKPMNSERPWEKNGTTASPSAACADRTFTAMCMPRATIARIAVARCMPWKSTRCPIFRMIRSVETRPAITVRLSETRETTPM